MPEQGEDASRLKDRLHPGKSGMEPALYIEKRPAQIRSPAGPQADTLLSLERAEFHRIGRDVVCAIGSRDARIALPEGTFDAVFPCRNLEVACSDAQIDLLDVAGRFAGVASDLVLKEVDILSIHDYPPWLLVGGRGRPAYHLERLEETPGSLLGERMREVSGEKEGLEGRPAIRLHVPAHERLPHRSLLGSIADGGDRRHHLVGCDLESALESLAVDCRGKPDRSQPQGRGIQDKPLEGVAEAQLGVFLSAILGSDIGICSHDDGARCGLSSIPGLSCHRDTCPYGPDEAVLKCRDIFSCGWLLQNSEMDLLLL